LNIHRRANLAGKRCIENKRKSRNGREENGGLEGKVDY
jgi:hypothetical protein